MEKMSLGCEIICAPKVNLSVEPDTLLSPGVCQFSGSSVHVFLSWLFIGIRAPFIWESLRTSFLLWNHLLPRRPQFWLNHSYDNSVIWCPYQPIWSSRKQFWLKCKDIGLVRSSSLSATSRTNGLVFPIFLLIWITPLKIYWGHPRQFFKKLNELGKSVVLHSQVTLCFSKETRFLGESIKVNRKTWETVLAV